MSCFCIKNFKRNIKLNVSFVKWFFFLQRPCSSQIVIHNDLINFHSHMFVKNNYLISINYKSSILRRRNLQVEKKLNENNMQWLLEYQKSPSRYLCEKNQNVHYGWIQKFFKLLKKNFSSMKINHFNSVLTTPTFRLIYFVIIFSLSTNYS